MVGWATINYNEQREISFQNVYLITIWSHFTSVDEKYTVTCIQLAAMFKRWCIQIEWIQLHCKPVMNSPFTPCVSRTYAAVLAEFLARRLHAPVQSRAHSFMDGVFRSFTDCGYYTDSEDFSALMSCLRLPGWVVGCQRVILLLSLQGGVQ